MTPWEVYRLEKTQMEEAEKKASSILSELKKELQPLFANWRTCQLHWKEAISSEIPEAGGHVQVKPTKHLDDLEAAMNRWASAQNRTAEAFDRLSPAEKVNAS
jgi:hypothetical protein